MHVFTELIRIITQPKKYSNIVFNILRSFHNHLFISIRIMYLLYQNMNIAESKTSKIASRRSSNFPMQFKRRCQLCFVHTFRSSILLRGQNNERDRE